MNIAFFDAKDYEIPYFEQYGEGAGINIRYFKTNLSKETVELARGTDYVCVFVNDRVGADVIDALESLGVRGIALRCAGYNNVDLERARGRIAVVHVPAYSPYAVAEHTMAMLLTSIRRLHKAYNRTRDFNFSLNGLVGFDLHGKTVGVIGTGKIGRVFIDICKGFGMHVLAYDPYPSKEVQAEYLPLAELYARSDIISFHCPLTAQSYHMLDKAAIDQLKKGVVIVNTSRGALVDAGALLEGIKERKIGAACLDVYEEETDLFFEDNSGHILDDDTLARLISMPNVLVSSHQAFLTEEALSNIARITTQNIKDLHEKGECANRLV
ncbi:MAG: 2-hydroxyacid dehydrogenase [Clostridia bacterium]|nr:2-hydroxyacid dehydrogenase [Clostridia bacterium]MBQ8399652.1 2-hydroxyacid dehydrogenase [Clostridia bacterium]